MTRPGIKPQYIIPKKWHTAACASDLMYCVSFNSQQLEIHNRRVRLKDEVIKRLKGDVDRLTTIGAEKERKMSVSKGWLYGCKATHQRG